MPPLISAVPERVFRRNQQSQLCDPAVARCHSTIDGGDKVDQNLRAVSNLKKLPTLGSHAEASWDAFKRFDQAALAEGAIPKKYKELLAIAVFLTTQCPYRIEVHSKAVRKGGDRVGTF
jgi:AhpD family alkylhydroperoxidase